MSHKAILDQLAGYNLWANSRFLECLQRETDELLDRPVSSSFPSIRATLLHIRDAENAWTHRLRGISPVPWPAEEDTSIGSLLKFTQRLTYLVLAADEAWFDGVADYKDLRGNTHQQVRWHMLLHCFNHGTQHRGQLITMMRTLGLQDIPANDLVVYQRSLRQG